MTAGMFGKLPSKRDFIAFRAPRPFLELWEPWLQESLAVSRHLLGAQWLPTFNRAPIWRYWLGADLCGAPVLGAFMSSVDGVGRPFPLTIFSAGATEGLPSPEVDTHDAWCEAAEALLLGALDHDCSFEELSRGVAALAAPVAAETSSVPSNITEFSDGLAMIPPGEQGLGAAFASCGSRRELRRRASTSYWWTIGGEDFPAVGLSTLGMPKAERYSEMLTGAFKTTVVK